MIIAGVATCLIICAGLGMLSYYFLQDAKVKKPVGLGLGPSFIGGMNTDAKGIRLFLRIFEEFKNYKMLTQADDENEYKILDNG